ncbi:hypothetical protein CDAR_305011 [Caerostris darwini]|uniref:Uncharacterized protein n=1 Tax=Caerostris darwini TaxID=1538125 RepID=A0AAV4UQS3_9ARAC|nr:hypothetical protein CDAR_305011 [Caerostris darwini]
MHRNRKRNYNQLVQFIEEMETTFVRASNMFDCLRQEVNAHTSLNPGNLTACDCRGRAKGSNILIRQLQKQRKLTEQLKELCEEALCEVEKYNPSTLSIRSEIFKTWKKKRIRQSVG